MMLKEGIRLAKNKGEFTDTDTTEITYYRLDKSIGQHLFHTSNAYQLDQEWASFSMSDLAYYDSVIAVRSK